MVNGSKIWTSRAEWADHIFLLVRTDPDAKKQLGITFLLMDMNQPGVEVKPLLAFNGARLWSRIFFENAMVPRETALEERIKGGQWRKACWVMSGYSSPESVRIFAFANGCWICLAAADWNQ